MIFFFYSQILFFNIFLLGKLQHVIPHLPHVPMFLVHPMSLSKYFHRVFAEIILYDRA